MNHRKTAEYKFYRLIWRYAGKLYRWAGTKMVQAYRKAYPEQYGIDPRRR